MTQLLFKSGLFAILAVICMNSVDRYFLNHDQGDIASFDDFYSIERETVDVLILGNSHLHRGIDPSLIEAKTGLHSSVMAAGGLTIGKIYYNLLESLSYQKPQLVVIECYSLFAPKWQNNYPISKNGRLRANKFGSESYKKLGFIKLEEIWLTNAEDKLFKSFALFRNHERWTDIEKWGNSSHVFLNANPRDVFNNSQKQHRVIDGDAIAKFNTRDFKTKDIRITAEEMVFMDKIIQLSKKHNFEILLFTVPVYSAYYEKTKLGFNRAEKQLDSFAKISKNVKFFDINRKYGGFDETYILYEKELLTNQHLSYKGIVKTTNELANFINSNYTFRTKNRIDKRTIEYEVVNQKIRTIKGFEGRVDKVNGQLFKNMPKNKTFTVQESAKVITIEGWMRKEGVDSLGLIRELVLYKDAEFFLRSGDKLKEKDIPYLVNNKGEDYRNVGYSYTIPKTSFDAGIYKIFHVIQPKNGKVFIHDTKIKIQIE